jgi:hypothetical protein
MGLAIALLAGCGGSPSGPGALPAGTTPNQAVSGQSWMAPATSRGDLVYISSYTDVVYVYSYPDGTLVGTLTGFNDPSGICSDGAGNVWITNTNSANIVEYAHGGTTPIATVSDSGHTPVDCSVDPTTGNLAAANYSGNVAVYKNAQGSPTYYSTVGLLQDTLWVNYDDAGNLFAASRWHTPVWMKKGSSAFKKFGLKPHVHSRHDGLQSDGTYVTLIGTSIIYRYSYRQVPGGKQADQIKLNVGCCSYYWIHGSEMAAAGGSIAYFFNYPAGGNPITTITGLQRAQGVAISAAPSR